MEITFFLHIVKGSYHEIGYVSNRDIKNRQFKSGDGYFYLVLYQFYHFGLIVAAAGIIVHLHPAFAADLCPGLKEMHRYQPLHAVMRIDHDTAAGSKVEDE